MNTLRQAVHEYLSMRRNLGFKLRHAGNALLDFVTFMEQRKALYITETLALVWAQQPVNVQPAYWAQRLSYVRGFARHRSATDPRTQIPSPSLLPFRPKRAKPYLYSDEEVQNLLRAALSIPQRSGRCALLPCGVAPLWWTPEDCAEEVSTCRRNNRRTRRSTGARWWSWFARAARPVSWLASSSALLRRSAIGYVKRTATRAVVRTV